MPVGQLLPRTLLGWAIPAERTLRGFFFCGPAMSRDRYGPVLMGAASSIHWR